MFVECLSVGYTGCSQEVAEDFTTQRLRYRASEVSSLLMSGKFLIHCFCVTLVSKANIVLI